MRAWGAGKRLIPYPSVSRGTACMKTRIQPRNTLTHTHTGDMGNLDQLDPDTAAKLPGLMKLKRALYRCGVGVGGGWVGGGACVGGGGGCMGGWVGVFG